ncbi:hypothetical protein JCM8547_000180 [Rhodosporidiobolus lusitaniae]
MPAPVQIPLAKGDEDDSPPTSPYLTSTSPPCIPHLPPSSPCAPSSSILLNPLPSTSPSTSPSAHSPSSSSLFGAPFRRVSLSSSSSAQAGPSTFNAPPRRRPSVVTVEVVHSPPPAHFYADLATDTDTDNEGRPSSPTGGGRGYSQSPPRASMVPPHEFRSRSTSPAATTHQLSPSSPSNPSASGSSLHSSSSGGSGSGSAGGGSVKFAPLPQGRRAYRSNSLTIGVASRARMIQAQGGTPDARGARYAGPLAWHEGGPLPEDVYTYKDASRALGKLFKKVKLGGSSSGSRGRPRSASTTSVLSATSDSGGSEAEARRMEVEAKSTKGAIEHIEEADEELEEDGGVEADEEEGGEEAFPATIDDSEEEEEEEEEMEPKTPPERSGALSREEEAERRRVAKGKGKAVVQDGQPVVV